MDTQQNRPVSPETTPPETVNSPATPAGGRRSHLDESLDEALEESFPASDSVSIAPDRWAGQQDDR